MKHNPGLGLGLGLRHFDFSLEFFIPYDIDWWVENAKKIIKPRTSASGVLNVTISKQYIEDLVVEKIELLRNQKNINNNNNNNNNNDNNNNSNNNNNNNNNNNKNNNNNNINNNKK
jgi:hypothetical protein